MAILGECSICHRKQSIRNKHYSCGENLSNAKRSQRLKYWISYRLPGGKQRREAVGFSIEEAKDAEGKRRSQKRENRIFDIKPNAKMTFKQLTEWYLNLEKVKAIKTYWRIKIALKNFNFHFKDTLVNSIKPIDIENYQIKRIKAGIAPGTVDKEIKTVHTMINKALDNDMIGIAPLKAFKRVKNLLKKNENARHKILEVDQFYNLLELLPNHTKAILATGFYTGMRKNEILPLTWEKVDLNNRIICLEAKDTKDKEPRIIPIWDELFKILKNIPKAIHDNHVFLYNGRPIKDIRGALKKGCEKAKITYGRFTKDGFVFHDLRHYGKCLFMGSAHYNCLFSRCFYKNTSHNISCYLHRFCNQFIKSQSFSHDGSLPVSNSRYTLSNAFRLISLSMRA